MRNLINHLLGIHEIIVTADTYEVAIAQFTEQTKELDLVNIEVGSINEKGKREKLMNIKIKQ